MPRMVVVLASLALVIAVGACGSSNNQTQTPTPAAGGGGAVNTQLPAGKSKPSTTTAKAGTQAPAAKPQARPHKLRPKDVYGVIYKGPKPKPLPPKSEALSSDPKSQALAGSITRSLAWANAFYGKSVLDKSADNACSPRGANRWSCSVTITILKPFNGNHAGNVAGGYTVTLDPASRQLTYTSGLS